MESIYPDSKSHAWDSPGSSWVVIFPDANFGLHMVVKITDQKMWMQVWCIPDHSWMSIEVKPCFTLGAEEELLNRPRLDCQITIVIGTDGVGMGQGSLVFFFVSCSSHFNVKQANG